ncbi:MAG: tRNA lysidine(34) synthetase TilS [Lachnospiraceae bacterium]|nr:tRNA lysidine(34) synthetase TilS [Lachnospiraceae bacterium]
MDIRAFERRAWEAIRTQHMADRGDGVLAAVSGGADSVCLLFLLFALKERLGIRLAAFHLNHGIRGDEAYQDEEYVRELCKRLAIPLKTERQDVARYAKERGMSVEEAGRSLRYACLERAARELSCGRIATAHHKDDQAETVLMNLFRGGGLAGLAGIPAVRGKIIRPLFEFSRQEIEAYLSAKGVAWRTDSTNKENVYMRNRLRNVLLPWVTEQINNQAAAHIVQFAVLAGQADAYFKREAGRLLGNDCSISTELFDAQPEIIRSYLVRELFSRAACGKKDITERHIRSVMGLRGPGYGLRVDLPDGFTAVRDYETLTIRRETEEVDRVFRPFVPSGTRVFAWEKGTEIPKKQYTKWFDYDKIKGTLVFRTRRSGDYFLIAGKKKTLRRYFIDEKIPRGEREMLLLLAEGSHILWIVGYRISDYYKLSEDTRTVIEIKADKGEKRHGGQDSCSTDGRGSR